MQKTNAMRLLDSAGIAYSAHSYQVDENNLSGVHVAGLLGIAPEQIFKTLVLKGEKIGHFVCCIPVDAELDFKKAAAAMNDKKAELLPLVQLLPATGYIRGGCSPIGMKKKFPTLVDEACQLFDEIYISSGTRGIMLRLSPGQLCAYLDARQTDLLRD